MYKRQAPESEIYGIDAEAVLALTDSLRISQSVGWKEGTFQEFNDLDIAGTTAAGSAVFVDRAGQDLGFPTLSYQGAVSHTMTVNKFTLVSRFDYAYRSDLELPLLGPVFEVDGYWLANASLEIAPSDGPWSLTLWGRNITNTDYDETRNFFTPGANVAAPGLVATYGARLNLSY